MSRIEASAVSPTCERGGFNRAPRVPSIDGLRAVAAMVVVLNHAANVSPVFVDSSQAVGWAGWLLTLVRDTPLHVVVGGRPAVMIFFTISGFALAASAGARREAKGLSLLRRGLRIYIPHVTVLLACLLLYEVLPSDRIDSLSSWFNSVWPESLSFGTVLSTFLLVPSFADGVINPVIWSLVHEVRVSLIYPVILRGERLIGGLNLLFSAAGVSVGAAVLEQWLVVSRGVSQNYTATLHFIPFFVSGSLIYAHQDWLRDEWMRLSGYMRWSAAVAVCVLYVYPWFLPSAEAVHYWVIDDFVSGLGAVGLVVISLVSKPVRGLLGSEWLSGIGKRTYGVYLTHAVLLIGGIRLLSGVIPVWLLSLGVVLLAFPFGMGVDTLTARMTSYVTRWILRFQATVRSALSR